MKFSQLPPRQAHEIYVLTHNKFLSRASNESTRTRGTSENDI